MNFMPNILTKTTKHVLFANKSVILFYPKESINVEVALDLDETVWDVTSCILLYPEPISSKYIQNKIKWKIDVDTNNIITYNSQKYAYLFWQATVFSNNFKIDPSNATCVESINAPHILDKMLISYGLNIKERQNLITCWLHDIIQKEYVVFQIIGSLQHNNSHETICFGNNTISQIMSDDSFYNSTTKLQINPPPDSLVRILLLFSGSDSYIKCNYIHHQDITRNDNEYWVVECGGINTNEF